VVKGIVHAGKVLLLNTVEGVADEKVAGLALNKFAEYLTGI